MVLLDVQRLSYSYDTTPVLLDISLEVRRGEIVGLIGPNGSGKSTLLRVVLDLLQAQEGGVTVDGVKHDSITARATTLFLASNDYLPQFLTAHEYLRMLAQLYDVELDATEAEDLFQKFSMQGRLGHLIEDYSHGMRKKTQLVSALLLRRPLTIIDETLNGIDLEALWTAERELRNLRDEQHSVLLVTHDLPLLERIADRIVFLDVGVVVSDTTVEEVVDTYGSITKLVSHYLDSSER